ncbi:MAG TPA: spermidine synthase, partial [Terricaulis sp.]|nr:spermidine synthase [Terricaulis sp.]
MEALARRAAAPVFALALFASAGLIFVLQPLFARMATPLLGGSPAVWNTSMAFFQAALLAGYLYAHLLARVKDLRIQAAVHIAVLIAAWLVLPVRVTDMLGPPS